MEAECPPKAEWALRLHPWSGVKPLRARSAAEGGAAAAASLRDVFSVGSRTGCLSGWKKFIPGLWCLNEGKGSITLDVRANSTGIPNRWGGAQGKCAGV